MSQHFWKNKNKKSIEKPFGLGGLESCMENTGALIASIENPLSSHYFALLDKLLVSQLSIKASAAPSAD